MSGARQRRRVSPWAQRECRLALRTDARGDPQGLHCLARMPVLGSARRVPPFMELISSGARMVLPSSEAPGRSASGPTRSMRVFETDVLPLAATVPAPFADPARYPDGRPYAGSGRCRSCSLHPSHRPMALRRIGPTAAPARRRLPSAFRPAHAGLPPQRRCGSGWSRSGNTARAEPPWPRSTVPTARESVLPPSPGAACACGRPVRR